MFIFLSACSLLVPLSMIILGYTWKDKPPKDRQGLGLYKLCFRNHPGDTIDFYFDFNER